MNRIANGGKDLFRQRLDAIIDLRHPLWRLTRDFGQAFPHRIELSHQAFGVTAPDWIQARQLVKIEHERDQAPTPCAATER